MHLIEKRTVCHTNAHVPGRWEIVAAASASLCSAATNPQSQERAQRSLWGPHCTDKKKTFCSDNWWMLLILCLRVSGLLLTGTGWVCALLLPRVWLCPWRWHCPYFPSRLRPSSYPRLLSAQSCSAASPLESTRNKLGSRIHWERQWGSWCVSPHVLIEETFESRQNMVRMDKVRGQIGRRAASHCLTINLLLREWWLCNYVICSNRICSDEASRSLPPHLSLPSLLISVV